MRTHVKWNAARWALYISTVPLIVWPLRQVLHGQFRWEMIAIMLCAPILAATSDATRKLYTGVAPLAYTAVLYDMMRFVQNVGVRPERVHICDLRAFEARWFGFHFLGVHGTLQDWFQAHPSHVLDVVCAIPYGTFIFVAVICAVWLFFVDIAAMQRFGWNFLLLNLAGFATYHAFPAGPPWYYHAHGCVADLSVHATEGPALARVDHWLGTTFFHAFYGRARDVFGAVPSLHAAYALLFAQSMWPYVGRGGRLAAAGYLVTMCFAAVYLDHHWISDVLIGLLYAIVVRQLVVRGAALLQQPTRAASEAQRRPRHSPERETVDTAQ